MLNELLYTIKRPWHLIKTGLLNGLPAQLKYRFPARKLHITFITGTDGKTTVATLLHHVLQTAGLKAGLLTTVAAYIGQKQIDTGFHVTSPQPADLHKFMRQMVEQNTTHLVLEVTSHGSYQYRTWGVKPQLAGITNVAHEHLDYHLSPERYLEAKAAVLDQAPTVVLNEDDPAYLKIRQQLSFDHTIETYSQEMSMPKPVAEAIKNNFPEPYNQSNARLAFVLAQRLGINDEDFTAAMESFPGIPGRMETIETDRDLELIVDFAHTPQALEAALKSLRANKAKSNNLIAVYGCAGLRDYAKRPEMGKIGSELADYVVFTAEDPRTEDVWSIIRQMKEQLTNNHNKVHSIADRYQAIEFAINQLAEPNDTVAVLGKGHEQSISLGTKEYPWSDKQVILDVVTSEKQ